MKGMPLPGPLPEPWRTIIIALIAVAFWWLSVMYIRWLLKINEIVRLLTALLAEIRSKVI